MSAQPSVARHWKIVSDLWNYSLGCPQCMEHLFPYDCHWRSSMAESGGVQSVERAFGLLEILGERGGEAGISELADASGLALPTIHRLIRTLLRLGYVRQLPSRRYAFGP